MDYTVWEKAQQMFRKGGTAILNVWFDLGDRVQLAIVGLAFLVGLLLG